MNGNGAGDGAGGDRRREHRRRAADPRRRPLGLHDLPRLRRSLPGVDRVRRQDRRHAPPSGAGGVALPGRADARRSRPWRPRATPGASTPSTRADWANGLDIPTMAEKPDAEYLYFVGCAGSFDDRAKRTTQAVAKIFKKAERRLRHPRRRGAVQRRNRAPHRQRVPLPDHGADGRRSAGRLQGAQDRHQLPALLQHVQERLPAVRRQLRGRARDRAGRAPDRHRQARASSSVRIAPSPSTTPATSVATTTSSRRRATSSR